MRRGGDLLTPPQLVLWRCANLDYLGKPGLLFRSTDSKQCVRGPDCLPGQDRRVPQSPQFDCGSICGFVYLDCWIIFLTTISQDFPEVSSSGREAYCQANQCWKNRVWVYLFRCLLLLLSSLPFSTTVSLQDLVYGDYSLSEKHGYPKKPLD